jgi:hypothetical protein
MSTCLLTPKEIAKGWADVCCSEKPRAMIKKLTNIIGKVTLGEPLINARANAQPLILKAHK